MLDELHQEHIHIARLLELLRKELVAIRSEMPVHYGLLHDILSYLSEVADQRHHPQEELIYDYSLTRTSYDNGALNFRLKQEHQQVVNAGKELTGFVDMILMDAVIPLAPLAEKLDAFVMLLQSHMDFEEQEIFPDLYTRLTEDDWHYIEQNWHYRMADDPLFGRKVAERYRDLSRRLGF